MTKSKNRMVTRVVLSLDIFPDEVTNIYFILLYLGRYLLSVVHGNRHQSKSSKENVLFYIIVTGTYPLPDR